MENYQQTLQKLQELTLVMQQDYLNGQLNILKTLK